MYTINFYFFNGWFLGIICANRNTSREGCQCALDGSWLRSYENLHILTALTADAKEKLDETAMCL